MANIKSAIKRIRQTEKQTLRNKENKSRLRTFYKRVLVAVESGDVAVAQSALTKAVSELAIAVRKGIIHKNQASRRTKRLNAKVKKLALAAS
ncbi:MAG: 30S ribosomal protein S20 [Magnetococcales bacterium]|nr:30S ribosomal protein S20 [Magnetococcales bacterium]